MRNERGVERRRRSDEDRRSRSPEDLRKSLRKKEEKRGGRKSRYYKIIIMYVYDTLINNTYFDSDLVWQIQLKIIKCLKFVLIGDCFLVKVVLPSLS